MRLCTETVGVFLLIFLVWCDVSSAKRSIGTRARAKSASTSWWGRKKTSGSERQSAKQNVKPAEPAIKKETSQVQHSELTKSPPPQPGWQVPQTYPPGHNTDAWKINSNREAAAAPPGYNAHQTWGPPPPYPGQTSNYKGFGQQSNGYAGYSPYGNYHNHQSVGGYNPSYGGMTMGSMGMGGMTMGSMGMGGHNYHGGYNPMGFGGSGRNEGYFPMKKKSSIFSTKTISSVIVGFAIYSAASKLISYGLGSRRSYNVINYYSQEPNKTVEEINLPSNVLVLCEGNLTEICGKGTQSVCTQNHTVLCVATMNQASPCDQDGNPALCVNTTLPCVNRNDPQCQVAIHAPTHEGNLEADISMPCVTNLTLDVNLVDQTQTQPNTKYTYCITTMAVAGPEYSVCDDLTNSNNYRSLLNGNYEWFLDMDGLRRNYSVYNSERPIETNEEIDVPVTMLIKCPDNAKNICVPGTATTCTTFNEIMCLVSTVDVAKCESEKNGCLNTSVPCPPADDTNEFCKNKTEGSDTISLSIPCFKNVTIMVPMYEFNLEDFNGILPDISTDIKVGIRYKYFNYCIVTLAIPDFGSNQCIPKEVKEKLDGEQPRT